MFSDKRPLVRESGDATAESGGVAITGAVGTVNVGALAPARSRYAEQVRQIAPPELFDRDEELARLAKFCDRAEPAAAYMWWRAPAWTGKSALMATFALNPPPGIRVVSFFVTARWAGNDDRVAFVDVVLEQLAEITGLPIPDYLTDATRYSHLLGLLTEADEACRKRDERLVLLVDGLDEDRGVQADGSTHSIAALLPESPTPGMRIVVASRLNPRLPSDVPPRHPLRRAAEICTLSQSPHAEGARHYAQDELKRLLRGTPAEQDLLGLICAAGGGLSAADLAELTSQPAWEMDDLLNAVSGRTFASRSERRDAATAVYVLGHEELQQQAIRFIGPQRLSEFRRRLHDWADSYRERDWPATTPEYLLRGYFRMLHETTEINRMISYATDAARHNRMMGVGNGDTAALAEIALVQEALRSQEEPDLAAAGRLAAHRHYLVERNANLPEELVQAWTLAGDLARAEVIARSIADKRAQETALTTVAVEFVRSGDPQRAEAVAHSLRDPGRALAAVALALAERGDRDRADTVVRSLPDPEDRARAHARIAVAVARAGDPAVARDFGAHAETAAREVTDPVRQAWVMPEIADALAHAGDADGADRVLETIDRATRIVTRTRVAETLARHGRATAARAQAAKLDRAEDRVAALVKVSRALAESGAGDAARETARAAEEAAGELDDGDPRAWLLLDVAEALARAGDVDGGLRVTLAVVERDADRGGGEAHSRTERLGGDPLSRIATAAVRGGRMARAAEIALALAPTTTQAMVLLEVARAAEVAGAREIARLSATAAEGVIASAVAAKDRPVMLGAIAGVLRRIGDGEAALAVAARAGSIEDAAERTRTLALVAEALAQSGDGEAAHQVAARALASARTMDDRPEALDAVLPIITAFARSGDAGAVRSIVAEAETLAGNWGVSRVAEVMAGALAAAGDVPGAERLCELSGDRSRQARILARIATARARAGAPETARQLAERTEDIARTVIDPVAHVASLVQLAGALTACGATATASEVLDRARKTSASIGDLPQRAASLATVGEAVLASGGVANALAIADEAKSIADEAKSIAGESPGHPRGQHFAAIAILSAKAGDGAAAEEAARKQGGESCLAEVAEILARGADPDRAEAIARDFAGRLQREATARAVGRALALGGDTGRALKVAGLITDPAQRDLFLIDLAKEVAAGGSAEEALRLARDVANPARQVWAMAEVAGGLATAGDAGGARLTAFRAESATHGIADRTPQVFALAKVTEALARAGEPAAARDVADNGELIARAIEDPAQRAWVRILLAEGLAQVADRDADALRRLADLAQAAARRVAEPDARGRVTTRIAEAYARVGDAERALAVAESIPESKRLEVTRDRVVEQLAKSGFADEALRIARSLTSGLLVLRKLVSELVWAGDAGTAEAFVLRIGDEAARDGMLAPLCLAITEAGNPLRAAAAAAAIVDEKIRTDTLATIAMHLPAEGSPANVLSLLENRLEAVDLTALARMSPVATEAFAKEYLHSLQAHGDQS
ncbi:hypothetical protein ACQPZX_15635 [Actinoplanes sp. CA-142083]|uniref:hypothetical protein n=1 Tax=Actinoplanes sp. CA-142083 TaxID=3239903 RepID=UPI003D89EF9D